MAASSQESLEKITTGDLGAGGTLPEQMFEQFFQEVQDSATLLGQVRTVPVSREKTKIPKIGVGERLRQGQAEDTAPASEETVNTGSVSIDCEKGSVYWRLSMEAVQENPERERLADIVMSQMTDQFSVDTQDLGINGDDTGTGFVAQNDGWLTLADAGGMNSYSHDDVGDGTGAAQPLNSDFFNSVIKTLPPKYRERTNPAFVISRNQLQEFQADLAGNQSDAAMMMLMGSSDLTPFDYPILAPSTWPDDRAMFTDPSNLVYALRDSVRVNVLENSDETHDNDLYAKYALHAKDDFAIEDVNAGVVASNIAAP